jgi:hypothetical protein
VPSLISPFLYLPVNSKGPGYGKAARSPLFLQL